MTSAANSHRTLYARRRDAQAIRQWYKAAARQKESPQPPGAVQMVRQCENRNRAISIAF